MPPRQRQVLVVADLGSAEPDLGGDRAVAVEAPAAVPVAELVAGPRAGFEPRHVGLRMAVGVVFVVADNGAVLRIEAERLAHVDRAAARGRGVDDSRAVLYGDRQFERGPVSGFPMDEVAAAGVRDVVVGGAVGRVAPHPHHVEEPVGAQLGFAGIGVHRVHAVEDRRVDQSRPTARGFVVAIVIVDAIAAPAVAEVENQLALLPLHKDRIGATGRWVPMTGTSNASN